MPRKAPPEVEFDPVCNLFPQHTENEAVALGEDIKANGQKFPILRFEGKIIDGRGRYRACKLVGVEPWIEDWEGERKDLIRFVVSVNLHRRHLNETQRASVGARLAAILRESPAADMRQGRASEQAAEIMNVSTRLVEYAAKAQEKGTPELVAAMDRGEMPATKAAKLSVQSPAEQARAINDEAKRARKAEDADVLQTLLARGQKDVSKAVKTFGKLDGRDDLPERFEEMTGYLGVVATWLDDLVEVA